MAMEMWLRTQNGVDDGSRMVCGIGVKFCIDCWFGGTCLLDLNSLIDSHWCAQ